MEKCIVHLRDNLQSIVGRRERKWFFLETCRQKFHRCEREYGRVESIVLFWFGLSFESSSPNPGLNF